MLRQVSFLLLIPSIVFCIGPARSFAAQTNSGKAGPTAAAPVATPPVAMPKDPHALMLLASQLNGLAGLTRPWHMKAEYEVFDADGKPQDQGVIEEWWAGPKKYKISYSRKNFHGTWYRNGDKVSGSPGPGSLPFRDGVLLWFLRHPLPGANDLKHSRYTSADKKLGPVPMHCVYAAFLAPVIEEQVIEDAGGTFTGLPRNMGAPATTCFNPKLPIVRIELSGFNSSVVFGDEVQVAGHYIPEDVWYRNDGLPLAHLHVTTFEFLGKIDDSEWVAPPKTKTWLAAKINGGKRLKGEIPTYPVDAQKKRIQGTVIMEVRITKTGQVTDVQLISGPKALRSVSLKAVKTWKFSPYTLNGQSVEILRAISVVWRMAP